ncbi:MAG TPA: rhodanese-like domain-containing protein [Acidimicrobiales bacterium]|nr:rhodanese-like domain-containing protein [Acidimicrobiales bacterium]
MTVSVDDLVERARRRIRRVGPHELRGVLGEGGLLIDIRPASQRAEEGGLPGAHVVERNVLEWRLDPGCAHRLAAVRDRDQPVVVVCSAGYASSLAAASLADLGYTRAADLVGGFQAWRSWFSDPGIARSGTVETVPL